MFWPVCPHGRDNEVSARVKNRNSSRICAVGKEFAAVRTRSLVRDKVPGSNQLLSARILLARCVAAKQDHAHQRPRDQLAPLHSMTSSARMSTDNGMSIPRVLALETLTSNST